MNKIVDRLKKLTLLVLVIAITMAAIPYSTVSAAGLTDDDIPPTNIRVGGIRLTLVWNRLQRTYDRQGTRLDRAETMVNNIQARLEQANQNGKDTSEVQAALDVFSQAIKDANPVYQSAKGIIVSHKGFDANGDVTDRIQALETIQSLRQSLEDVRNLVSDPFKLLRDALKAFRDANSLN